MAEGLWLLFLGYYLDRRRKGGSQTLHYMGLHPYRMFHKPRIRWIMATYIGIATTAPLPLEVDG